MEERNLTIAFEDSLAEPVAGSIETYAEIGLDSIMDDGLLKEIPFISTAVAIYRIGSSIRERHHVLKLIAFLNEINNSTIDGEQREKYKKAFKENERFREKELEYILVIIDRYITLDKPRMLAKLYLAYLDEGIVWEELTMYAEVIDRFLLLDSQMLVSEAEKFIVHRNIGDETILRLVALGLMTEITNSSPYEQRDNGNIDVTWDSLIKAVSNDKIYKRTEFGNKLAIIIRESKI